MKELIQFWPQFWIILWIVLSAFKGIVMEGVEVKYTRTPIKTFTNFCLYAFNIFALWYGGFFNHIGIIQIIYLFLLLFVLIAFIYVIFFAPEAKEKTRKIENGIITDVLILAMFYWSGFFDSLIQFINQ